LHRSRQSVVGHAGHVLSPKTCPFASNQPESTTQTASRSAQPFLHRSERAAFTPLIIAPSHGDLDPNLIIHGSRSRQTDILTADHGATQSVTIDRIYVYVVLRCGLIIAGHRRRDCGLVLLSVYMSWLSYLFIGLKITRLRVSVDSCLA